MTNIELPGGEAEIMCSFSRVLPCSTGLRLDITRTEHVQFAPVAVQALFAGVAEIGGPDYCCG